MPITYSEKTIFSKKSESIAEKLIHLDQNEFENTVLLFKVLAHALRNNEVLVQNLDETIFENPAVLMEKFNVLLQHALSEATAAATAEKTIQTVPIAVKEYTPTQLSKYFGVSIVTIHNWLKQGRFEDIKHAGDNKHNKIPENTCFIASSGDKMLVSDVVEMWNRQEAESDPSPSSETELEYVTRSIAEYEQKYNGEYKRTLGAKKNLTPKEETDAEIWRYLLGRQMREFSDTKE